MIDLEFIERLIRTLDESGLDHVEIERGGTRVRISRSPPVLPSEPASEDIEQVAEAVSRAEAPERTPRTEEVSGTPEESQDGLVEITSPMVGTFYRAASPDAEPFAEVGTRIAAGDVLCIIEAMKLMNELEAEAGGVIKEICIDDGEPVEYGQVLFRVQAS